MSHSHSPWVSGNEDLREADDIGALASSLLDESDGLGNTALEVVPGGLGLDGRDLELGSHF